MTPPIFPLGRPESGDDDRFTLGLALDVLGVLAGHGYPDASHSAADVLAIQQMLFRFLYGPASTPDTQPPAESQRPPWRLPRTNDQQPDDTTWVGLTPVEADGLACVVCGRNYLRDETPHVPVGYAFATGGQVFACAGRCAELAEAPFDPGRG